MAELKNYHDAFKAVIQMSKARSPSTTKSKLQDFLFVLAFTIHKHFQATKGKTIPVRLLLVFLLRGDTKRPHETGANAPSRCHQHKRVRECEQCLHFTTHPHCLSDVQHNEVYRFCRILFGYCGHYLYSSRSIRKVVPPRRPSSFRRRRLRI